MPLRSRPADDDQLDAVFHALADRTRRALLARLADSPAMITQLAAPFAMSLPAVSKHLRVLEGAGLVSRTIDGRVHRCSLAPQTLRDVDSWLAEYRSHWEQNLDSLARHLDKRLV